MKSVELKAHLMNGTVKIHIPAGAAPRNILLQTARPSYHHPDAGRPRCFGISELAATNGCCAVRTSSRFLRTGPYRRGVSGTGCVSGSSLKAATVDRAYGARPEVKAELWKELVGASGFEPPTSWSRTRRSSQAEPRPEQIQCRLSPQPIATASSISPLSIGIGAAI